MRSVLFVQVLLALARAESADTMTESPDVVQAADSTGTFPARNTLADAFAQPTCPATVTPATSTKSHATTTSPPIVSATPSPTGAPTSNIMNHGAEGDLKGPAMRDNLVYFGVGRHGIGFGATLNDCGHGEHNREPCADNNKHAWDHSRVSPPPPVPCDENRNANPPYLRVTPTLVVQDVTKTFVETATSTHSIPQTEFATRTVTDTLVSTMTELYHPVKTVTVVEQRSAYEYPASTIDLNRVRAAPTLDRHNC